MKNPDITLKELRAELSVALKAGKLVRCEVCEQPCKVYKRSLNRSMALALLLMVRYTRPGEEVHLPTLLANPPGNLPTRILAGFQGGDKTKLRYWGLIEPVTGVKRTDGSKRTGWYIVTPFGRSFARGEVFVKKFVRTYNDKVLSLEEPMIKISTAVGEGFNFDDLMSA